ncbi:hypothetical protein [Thioalkalivibrio sp. ALE19]|uniref:hypothetical protein n=1 Tax=Thioalkalivibrio sp. ALE19 TaxID=1266909 RepID=UPI0003F8CD3A|nr:hypothetical protein [Thioalkalivibrio sp. ALE19]
MEHNPHPQRMNLREMAGTLPFQLTTISLSIMFAFSAGYAVGHDERQQSLLEQSERHVVMDATMAVEDLSPGERARIRDTLGYDPIPEGEKDHVPLGELADEHDLDLDAEQDDAGETVATPAPLPVDPDGQDRHPPKGSAGEAPDMTASAPEPVIPPHQRGRPESAQPRPDAPDPRTAPRRDGPGHTLPQPHPHGPGEPKPPHAPTPQQEPTDTPPVPYGPERVQFEPVAPDAGERLTHAAPSGEMYMECERVDGNMTCQPIEVRKLAEAAVQQADPIEPIPEPVPTGRVDRNVATPESAIHDPNRESPDPDGLLTYGPIDRGDTVLDIAQEHYDPETANLYDIAAAIVRHNPHAFRDGNPDDLMLGTMIELPGIEEVRAGSWASLTKQAPPETVAEGQSRPIDGVDAHDPIINVQPVPSQDPEELAMEIGETGTLRPSEDRADFMAARGGERAAHPRQMSESERQEEKERIRAELRAIDARLGR